MSVRVKSEAGSNVHYLGKIIQNELIDSISSKIIKDIVKEIETSKYFSIILDCTTDLSHKEQLSVIVRIVSQEEIPQVKEHCSGLSCCRGVSMRTFIITNSKKVRGT